MRIALFLMVLLQFGCISRNDTSKEKMDNPISLSQDIDISREKDSDSSDINVSVPYEESVMLLGRIDRNGLSKDPFKTWFETEYNNFRIDSLTISHLKPLLKDISIVTFIGTWCEDSQRETPGLYRILDATDFDFKNFSLIAVSKDKDTPFGYEKGMGIEYVPTIILYRDKKEIGRFVEFAQESLEKDLLAIVSGNDYKHSYEE